MSGIFISYRREDGGGYAGRLFDRLTDHFGRDEVFMDVSDIEPGADFVAAIERAVGSCDVLVAVIGNQWLDCGDADGARRLDNPNDFVRLEIGRALTLNRRVIPLLIRGASMPSADDLPPDLRRLSSMQALELSDNRWDYDTGRLVEAVEKIVPATSPTRPERTVRRQIRARLPSFDSQKVVKADYRTWKWEDRVGVRAETAFQAADKALKKLDIKVRNVDFPNRIQAVRGIMTSGWSAIITGGEDIVIELDAIDAQQTTLSVSSRSRQGSLIDPLGTNRGNIQSIVETMLAILGR